MLPPRCTFSVTSRNLGFLINSPQRAMLNPSTFKVCCSKALVSWSETFWNESVHLHEQWSTLFCKRYVFLPRTIHGISPYSYTLTHTTGSPPMGQQYVQSLGSSGYPATGESPNKKSWTAWQLSSSQLIGSLEGPS